MPRRPFDVVAVEELATRLEQRTGHELVAVLVRALRLKNARGSLGVAGWHVVQAVRRVALERAARTKRRVSEQLSGLTTSQRVDFDGSLFDL